MTKAAIIEHDTWLYHPSKGSRLFGAGEQHPGGSWSDEPSASTDQTKTFDADWVELSGENTRLEGQNSDLTEKLGVTQAALDTANGEIAELKAQIAKFDGDGDGKPGGRAAKA